MKFKKLNRKGYAGALVDFFAWIAYFIILIIFIALFYFTAKNVAKNEALNGVDISSESSILYSYLRTPVSELDKTIYLKDAAMADLIARYYVSGKVNDLYPLFENFFGPVFYAVNGYNFRTWRIKIYLMPEKKEIFNKIGSNSEGGLVSTLLSDAIIPLPSEKEYLKLELYKEGTGNLMNAALYKEK